jgi:hypothetical protein
MRGVKMSIKNLILLLLIFGMSISNAYAKGEPMLEEIVSNVVRTSISPNAYKVPVNQSIYKPDPVASSKQVSSASTPTAPNDVQTQTAFRMSYDPAKGVSSENIEEAQAQATVPSQKTEPTQPEIVVNITFDLQKLLDDVEANNTSTVESEVLDGRQHYKVIASDDESRGFTLWIDAELSCLTKFTMDIQGSRFAEAKFEYQQYDDLLLPKTVVISHASDGSVVTQQFGNYEFIK